MSTNGRLASSELLRVQTGRWAGRGADIYLAQGAGNAYLAMAAACRAAGRSLEIAEPMGGYRPYADQAQMRADWYAHNWTPYNLDPHSTVPPAPAGTSNHGLGVCVDIWGTGYEWAVQNAHRWGFSRPFPTTDPHHFQHDGRTATAGTGSTVLNNTAPTHRKADDMPLMFYAPASPAQVKKGFKYEYRFLYPDGRIMRLTSNDQDQLNALAAQCGGDAPDPDGTLVPALAAQLVAQASTAAPAGSVSVDLSPLEAKLDALIAAVLAPETTTKTTKA